MQGDEYVMCREMGLLYTGRRHFYVQEDEATMIGNMRLL